MSNAFTTLSLIKFKEKKYSDAEVLAAYENKKRICETEREIKLKNPIDEQHASRLEKFYDAYITELENAFQQIKTSEKREAYSDYLISEEKRTREEFIKKEKEKEELKKKNELESQEKTDERNKSSLTARVDKKYLELQKDYARLREAYDTLNKDKFISSSENQKDDLKFTPIVKGKFEENETEKTNTANNKLEEDMER